MWQNDFFIEARSCFFAPCEGQICANVGLTLNYSRASDCRGLNSEWISRFLLPRFSATSCPPYLLSVETQPVVLRLWGVGYPSHRFTLNLQHSTLPRPPSAHNRSKMPIFLQTNSPLLTCVIADSIISSSAELPCSCRCVVGDLRKKFILLAH